MLLKMVILVKRENLIKATLSNEYIVSLTFKDKMHIPSALLLLFFCFLNYLRLAIKYESIFLIQKYIAFSTIRNCMYKRDMEFRPFCLIVRHLVCNLKIPLINSVITPFKVLIISIADWKMFWWWIETKPCNKSIFIKYLFITARPYQWVQLNCDLKKCIH